MDPGVWSYSFAINLGAGADLMITKRIGVFAEVAHRFYTGDKPSLTSVDGVTHFNMGGVLRF